LTPFKGTPFNSIDFETIKNKWIYDVRNYRKLPFKPLQQFWHVDGGNCLSVLIITGWWPGSDVDMKEACLEKTWMTEERLKYLQIDTDVEYDIMLNCKNFETRWLLKGNDYSLPNGGY
jgi:hypothetical protein